MPQPGTAPTCWGCARLTLILPAHGSPVQDPVKRIDAILARRRQKVDDLYNLVAAAGTRGMTFHSICSEVLPKAGRIHKYLSQGMLQASLDYLVKEKGLTSYEQGGKTIYRTCSPDS